jgi:hypothetical protein
MKWSEGGLEWARVKADPGVGEAAIMAPSGWRIDQATSRGVRVELRREVDVAKFKIEPGESVLLRFSPVSPS